MTNIVPIQNNKALIGPEEIKILKDSFFKGFTDAEVNFAVAISNQLQLSPLLRHIHFVKRKDNKTGKETIVPQSGIDGLRLTAERTGKYAGSDEPVFVSEGNSKAPSKATVTVYKMVDGQRCPFTATAYWDEYYPQQSTMQFMWNRMPKGQLAKCAEALALRKAFPAELASLYADVEMEQAEGRDKAGRVQKQVTGEEKESKQPETIDAEFTEQTEQPEEPNESEVPPCPLCGAERLLSSSKKAYYCPNWNDKKGEHPRLYL